MWRKYTEGVLMDEQSLKELNREIMESCAFLCTAVASGLAKDRQEELLRQHVWKLERLAKYLETGN